MKELIIDMFYSKNMSQKSISEELGISKSYVSKVVTLDSRYLEYKNNKIKTNKKKHNKQIQTCVEAKRKKLQFNYAADDLILKKMHNQATCEMSKSSHLSNENLYAKIIYCGDKTKKFEIAIVDTKTTTYVERCSVLLSNNPVSKLNAIIKLFMEYIGGVENKK